MTSALDDRLRALADVLDVDDTDLADDVIARLGAPQQRRARSAITGALRIAAALVVLLAIAVAAVPSSRRAVADWLGFDGARIERRPAVTVPAEPDPLDRDSIGSVGTVGTVVDVGEDEVLVSEFVGTLDNPALNKTVGGGTNVRQVTVGGALALWIDGAPHEVSFLDADGQIVFEGFAGNTLLWQDGAVIRRLEGFADVDTAIEYAESIGT